jgi:ABC-type spermidine/putrescine transport system permease subunit I
MVFIPKEAQEKIQALEAEVQRLQDAVNQAPQEVNGTPPTTVKKGVSAAWVFLALICIALLFVTQIFSIQLFGKKATSNTISQDSLEVVMTELDRLRDYEDVAAFRKDATAGSGTIFRVQIGAYKGQPLKGFEPNIEEVFEHQKDGFNIYTLGTFSSLKRAQAFQALCQEMGMPNAYVIAFRDGKPISLGEATKN